MSDMQLNNQKDRFSKGKSTKIAAAFMQNKANFKNIKIDVSSFEKDKYETLSAWRGEKTNPIQTQFKANTNPIHERPKMNVRNAVIMNYETLPHIPGKKTNPIQTQNKAKIANLSPTDNQPSFYPQGIFNNRLEGKSNSNLSLNALIGDPIPPAITIPATLIIDETLHLTYNHSDNF